MTIWPRTVKSFMEITKSVPHHRFERLIGNFTPAEKNAIQLVSQKDREEGYSYKKCEYLSVVIYFEYFNSENDTLQPFCQCLINIIIICIELLIKRETFVELFNLHFMFYLFFRGVTGLWHDVFGYTLPPPHLPSQLLISAR